MNYQHDLPVDIQMIYSSTLIYLCNFGRTYFRDNFGQVLIYFKTLDPETIQNIRGYGLNDLIGEW